MQMSNVTHVVYNSISLTRRRVTSRQVFRAGMMGEHRCQLLGEKLNASQYYFGRLGRKNAVDGQRQMQILVLSKNNQKLTRASEQSVAEVEAVVRKVKK